MTIIVTRDLSQPLRHTLQIRDHLISIDGSVDEGGGDLGPSPHDLYDASLAACKALTLVWYARRKGIELTDLRVETERDSSQERDGIYRLSTKLHLSGNLTDTQRRALLSAAGKCPIHKLMTSVTTEITTELA